MAETAIAATFAHRHEADFARATLESAGIDSVLIADDAGGAYAGLSFTGQVRLLVHESNLDTARQVLADSGTEPTAADTVDDLEG
jgi:hypothetical protein